MKCNVLILVGMINWNYVLGNGFVLKDNMIKLDIKDEFFFIIYFKLSFFKELFLFVGNINFENGIVELVMRSDGVFYCLYKGGYLIFD